MLAVWGTLICRVFVPYNILAVLAGDENIKISILVHVYKSDVVGGLVIIDDMSFEFSFAVIFKPCSFPAQVSAGCCIDVTVIIDITNL